MFLNIAKLKGQNHKTSTLERIWMDQNLETVHATYLDYLWKKNIKFFEEVT